MNWILIAITSGLGRKAMLEKDKITNSKCVQMTTGGTPIFSDTFRLCSNGICN